MKKSIRVLLIVLCVVFAGVFAFSGYKLYSIMHEYKESERRYDGLSTQFVAEGSGGSSGSGSGPVQSPFQAPAAELPDDGAEHSPIEVNFEGLLELCPDVVGWIYSEGTVINYPIARGQDNDYYLHRYIDGEYNGGGTPFMDFKNYPDFSDPNSLVYGHHMNDGSMFASLKKYNTDPAYYSEHPIMYLNTPTQNYRLDIFAGYVCDADSNTYTIGFGDDASFQAWIDQMVSQSDFETDVVVTPQDHIITLSTCSYEWYDARYVIQAVLVPID